MDGVLNRNIKNFRTFRGITQEELAKSVGKSKNVISNWERGDNSPDVDSVELICEKLEISPNQLFGWELCNEYEEYKKMIRAREAELKMLNAEKEAIQEKIDKLMLSIKLEEEKRNA